MVAKDRSRAKGSADSSAASSASASVSASGASAVGRERSNKNMEGAKSNDSIKLTKERSRANLKRESSTIKE